MRTSPRQRRNRPPSPADTLRALRDEETGGDAKPFNANASIALCYANTYHVAMSSLGFQTLHARLNARPDASAERFFWDATHPDFLQGNSRRPHAMPADMDYGGDELAPGDAPSNWPSWEPLGMETQTRLSRFPIIAFSVAFEMDYFHLVDMLVRAGLEPWAARRGPEDPLVVIGGAAVTMNRLPVYDFADVIAHGDGEEAVDALADALREAGPGRERLRAAVRGRPGLEVTSPRDPDDAAFDPAPLVTATRLSMAERLEEIPTHSHILTPHTEFARRGLIELSRGCPYKCTFCIMGYQPFQYHYREPGEIERQARLFLPHTRRVGLVASAVGVHKHIEEICDRLIRLDMDVSFSSLRVEDVKPRMIDALLHAGQKTLTIAPEAGNDRLRIRMRKRLTNERIVGFTHGAIARGMRNVKLYFMAGVNSETEDDVLSIASLTRELHAAQVDAARSQGRIGHLALNVGVFVPKPGTPQHDGGFIGVKEARRRLRLLQAELKRIPNLKVHMANPHLAATQTILSCGDRRAADFIWWAWRSAKGNWSRANREFTHLLAEHEAPREPVA